MRELTDGFDIASLGELEMVLARGQDPRRSASPGPASATPSSRRRSRHGVTLNLESEGEARARWRSATGSASTPRLAIRVNPDFELRGSGMKMGGGAKPFGVDAERVPALAAR
jgi:diaminopimelate decarboxylase